MGGYVILTNRKRAIVALAHSVAFLALATYGLRGAIRPLQTTSPPALFVMPAIYLLVSSALVTLTAFAGNVGERLYFGFCATSASFGLARQIAGDPRMHAAVYVRVAMLACAVLTGLWILRGYRRPATA